MSLDPPSELMEHPAPSWRLLVDLSLLRPGGETGGAKPFIFEYLCWMARQEGDRLVFIFLTWSCSHHEVRALARPWDKLVCVRHTKPGPPVNIENWRMGESLRLNPPIDLALEFKADLIYSPFGSPEFYCPGIPFLASIVDVLHRDYPMTLPQVEIVHRERLFQELACTADAFQCISDLTASRLRHHYSIPPSRIFRSYVAIHERLEGRPMRPTAQAGRPYFLYPANAWAHKNHQTLLVAYGLYRSQAGDSQWDLVLTGHEDERMHDVLRTAKALGLENSVFYHGHLDDDEFGEVWQHAGALVFASLHEGFGIPLVEAMHYGVPILCSSECSLPEVAGDAALLVDTRNPAQLATAMLRMSQDNSLRHDLVGKGHARLAEFAIEKEGRSFLGHCRRLLSEPRRVLSKGIYPDGWTEPAAILGLPSWEERCRVQLTVAPMPAPRRVRFYLGVIPLGGFSLVSEKEHHIEFVLYPCGRPLVLKVADATNLNPEDHRVHGILLAEARVMSQDDQTVVLWPAQP
jgi:glycosyltransferase involved in cell wall biosynthesis